MVVFRVVEMDLGGRVMGNVVLYGYMFFLEKKIFIVRNFFLGIFDIVE